MRKKLLLFLISIFVLTFTTCSNNGENEMTEFQKFMTDQTILVMTESLSVNQNSYPWDEPPRIFVAEDFAPMEVTEIYWINEELYESLSGRYNFYAFRYFLAIKVNSIEQESINETLEQISNLEFVDAAWVNQYDYTKNPGVSEKKSYVDEPDAYVNPSSYGANPYLYIRITIDKNYTHRVFTVEDFKTVNAISARWDYDIYTRHLTIPDEDYHEIYHIRTEEQELANLKSSIVPELLKFDFVKNVKIEYSHNPTPFV